MADIRLITLSVLYIIWWPINHILRTVVFILTPIWTLLGFILLPFIHLAQATFSVITFPFRGKWLDRIETLYIYLGTAGLIGCMTGALIFILFKFVSSSLNLDSATVPVPRDRSRTTADFRGEQREKKKRMKKEEPFEVSPAHTPVILKRVPGARRQGLLSQAIIEEEDSDF